jgi:acyl-CoA thioester hydrolase
MEKFTQAIEVRWSDLDPNFHLRHSVYYDYAAFCRIAFFEKGGLPTHTMQEMQFGPILFREEAVFRKEIRMGEELYIDLQLTKSRKDFSRWSIRHHLIKNREILAAVITVDGAWINTALRKLATPPGRLVELFLEMPKSEDFEWV